MDNTKNATSSTGECSLEDMITDFRDMLPADCATAMAIDQGEPRERVALRAMEDGYIEVVDQFSSFVAICLGRGGD